MMKLKGNLILFSCFILSFLKLEGQTGSATPVAKTSDWSLNVEVGLNRFEYQYSNFPFADFYPVASHYEAVSLTKDINPRVSVSFGLRNLSYGYTRTFPTMNTTPIDAAWYNWTIQTPLSVKIKPFLSQKLYVDMGVYFGFNYHNSATLISSSNEDNFVVNPLPVKNEIDNGLTLGLEYYWFNKGKFSLGNSFTYYRGFNDIRNLEGYSQPTYPFNYKAEGFTFAFKSAFRL